MTGVQTCALPICHRRLEELQLPVTREQNAGVRAHGIEAEPVQRRGAEFAEGAQVFGRAIALVGGQAVSREDGVPHAHQLVTPDLGDDGGGGTDGIETIEEANFTTDPTNAGVLDLWRGPWPGILYCNLVIQNVPNITFLLTF